MTAAPGVIVGGAGGYAVQTMQEELDMLRSLKGHVIKSYKAGRFCDITLKSNDGKEIKAHKMILNSQNAFFARRFDATPDVTEFDLSKFSGDIIQTVVDLMYFKPLNPAIFTKDNVQEYLKAGDYFFIDSIRDEASVFMAKNIDLKYALDMIQKPLFEGKMAEDAMNFVAENFQTFLSDEKLKKKLLNELKPVILADLLSMKNLMLWNPKTGRYSTALDREKQLFFFILAYCAQEKDRFEDLKMLLSSLKMSLLASKKIINCHMIGAGLKKPVEYVSGQISDLLEPFDKLDDNSNLALYTVDDKKHKAKDEDDQKFVADSCRMRYGSIPHTVHCSDVNLKLDPWSKMNATRSQFCPGPFKQQTAICKKEIKSITIFVCRVEDLTKKVSEDEKEENSKTPEKKEEKSKDEDKDKEKKDDDKDGSEKEKEGEKSEQKKEGEDEGGEWVLCGIAVNDGTEHSLGKIEGVGVKSKKYDLEATEYVTEIYAHFPQEKVKLLDSRGKRKELVAQELFSMTTVEDMSFKTNKDNTFGPVREGTKVGTIYKLPKQITRLEKEAPANYWWLQGFGMETLGLETDPPGSRPTRFYPIWTVQTANKYYPAKYEDIEFIAGVKKHNQFSVKGIEETCVIQTAQDLDLLEKTPVHEVVDIGDSDEEAEGNGDAVYSDDENEQKGKAKRPNKPGYRASDNEEDSVMIVDSDSDGEGGGEKEDADTTNEESDQQSSDAKQDKTEDMGGDGIFGGNAPADIVIQGESTGIEPIEIPSSSEESDSEGSGKGKRKPKLQNGSSGKKAKS